MQVLGWQCRILHKHVLDYDGANLNHNNNSSTPGDLGITADPTITVDSSSSTLGEDVPSSQQGPMVASPVPGPAPAQPLEETVLAGFRDCSEEAIRYLVDVEQLSEDDPLVVGLKQHLWDKQQHLDVGSILQMSQQQQQSCCFFPGGFDPCTGLPSGGFAGDYRTTQASDQQHHHNSMGYPDLFSVAGVMQPPMSPTSSRVDSGDSDSSFCTQGEGQPMMDSSMEEAEASHQQNTPISQQSTLISQQQTVISPGSHHPFDSECLQQGHMSVMDLAMLAQSNPAIASLTEEILSLLQSSEGHESDFESDLDIDLGEEGHTSD